MEKHGNVQKIIGKYIKVQRSIEKCRACRARALTRLLLCRSGTGAAEESLRPRRERKRRP
eukprot:1830305-Heterocapsa_arctica.AAC.1